MLASATFFLAVLVGFLFVVGTILHGIVAFKTGHACRWGWWYILCVAALMATIAPLTGTVIGALTVAALFWLKPFRIMRKGVEPSVGGYRR